MWYPASMRTHALAAVCLVACAAAPARPAGPSRADQRLAQLEARVGVLEDKVEAQDEQLEALSLAAPPVPTEEPHPGRDPGAIYALDLTDAPELGAADAKLTLVEAYDFACPYCSRARPVVTALMAKYAPDIRLVILHLPIFPAKSGTAALAACAANLQGKYFAYADQLWTSGFPAMAAGGYDDAHLTTYARAVGLKLKQWNADRASPHCVDWLAEQARRRGAIGVTGTPTFYVNGHVLSGAQPQPQFETLLDSELKKANQLIAAGKATARDYYQTQVMAVGQQAP
jgi:protein-disulfide isomerase